MQSNKPLVSVSDPPIAVIVPTRNEAACIAGLIAALRAMPEVCEIIVSDGGSTDDTIAIARKAGAKVVCDARGRGAQLNAGAHEANAKVLWFLHADVRVHSGSGRDIPRATGNPRVPGGNFRLTFDSATPSARFVAQIARWQRRRGVFYGDSGIWVTRAAWNELEGFRDWPLFEDLDFARRLQRLAQSQKARLKYFHRPIVASSRRFERRPWPTLGLWLALQILFDCGVAPQRLAAIYHRAK